MRITVLGNGSRYDVVKEALDKAGHKLVRSMNPDSTDLIVLANYSTILKKEQYENVKYGAINCHGGRLPQYRGSSVLNWQIINDEKEFGYSIIQVDECIDTGDILWSDKFDLDINYTIQDLRMIIDDEVSNIIPKVVYWIEEGVVSRKKQKDRGACYWHHRKPDDSYIKWDNLTAKQVHNLVRASEEPYEAFCYKFSDGMVNPTQTIYIPKAKLLQDTYCGVAGRVVRKIDDGVVVIAKDRGIWIKADLKLGDQLW
jgi:methionyl-tRNA formyltransferase